MKQACKLYLFFLPICCGIYPLVIYCIAQLFAPHQANGSLLYHSDGTVIGSALIAQKFTSERYFHPRSDSASGVDPHISWEEALSQLPRVAADRKVAENHLREIVEAYVETPTWSILGTTRVNVFLLNLYLDKHA